MKDKKKILAVIYRRNGDKKEFLALKNNPRDPIHGGDFYFVVTGGIKKDENVRAAVRREILEETGITDIINIVDLNKTCTYVCEGEAGYVCKESEFLVEVNADAVKLNNEHIGYKWLEKDAFMKLVAWSDKIDLNLILNKI